MPGIRIEAVIGAEVPEAELVLLLLPLLLLLHAASDTATNTTSPRFQAAAEDSLRTSGLTRQRSELT
ncbi:MAG: hypothetical protein J2P57_11700 [Acidimicrobiaceae bacterium]|nr:hypothetical protein [Acidimicrobiaceae bacterium]